MIEIPKYREFKQIEMEMQAVLGWYGRASLPGKPGSWVLIHLPTSICNVDFFVWWGCWKASHCILISDIRKKKREIKGHYSLTLRLLPRGLEDCFCLHSTGQNLVLSHVTSKQSLFCAFVWSTNVQEFNEEKGKMDIEEHLIVTAIAQILKFR